MYVSRGQRRILRRGLVHARCEPGRKHKRNPPEVIAHTCFRSFRSPLAFSVYPSCSFSVSLRLRVRSSSSSCALAELLLLSVLSALPPRPAASSSDGIPTLSAELSEEVAASAADSSPTWSLRLHRHRRQHLPRPSLCPLIPILSGNPRHRPRPRPRRKHLL